VITASKTAGDGYLPARAVWERYGVTSMTIYRWIASEDLGFPPPIYLGRFRYWRLADLIAWEMSRPTSGTPFGTARQRAPAEAA
jgi:predicted DNA-binding transcriptional regulator AlpA